mmetsp:Transcript_64824/g.153247  ORF Transcript_64824/g.153247 Transcript_64824/m.153247 type:complete len:92 (-) Transcript_64824:28-303(-)
MQRLRDAREGATSPERQRPVTTTFATAGHSNHLGSATRSSLEEMRDYTRSMREREEALAVRPFGATTTEAHPISTVGSSPTKRPNSSLISL